MKRRVVIIFFFICALAAAALVYGTVRKDQVSASDAAQQAPTAADGVVYVFYAGTYLSLDKDGVVCANNSSPPGTLPEIGGISFDSLTYGKKADAVERSGLEYLIRIACSLEKHGIKADRIEYDNRMATINIGKLRIEMGKDEKTDEKLTDLSDLIDHILGESGTLYMQNGNANNYGYTFRSDQ